MVRLLQYEAFGFTAMETFQFLNGTIITFLLKLFAVANFLFQFLNGTIITRRGQEHGRLLAVSIPQWYDYYVLAVSSPTNTLTFQFLNGTIIT